MRRVCQVSNTCAGPTDRDGKCCGAKAVLTTDGQCCSGSLDANGNCCGADSKLNACGLCVSGGGSHAGSHAGSWGGSWGNSGGTPRQGFKWNVLCRLVMLNECSACCERLGREAAGVVTAASLVLMSIVRSHGGFHVSRPFQHKRRLASAVWAECWMPAATAARADSIASECATVATSQASR